ncbi:hypothetical protein JL720_16842 [Aureococcus anophagefferens]|nr:hypothetical protein JL720_16842 [Aureococcus anophagefferens]
MDRPHLWPEVGRFAFSDQAAYDRRAETRNGTCVDWARSTVRARPSTSPTAPRRRGGTSWAWAGSCGTPCRTALSRRRRRARPRRRTRRTSRRNRAAAAPDAGVALAPGWLAHHAGACDFVLVTCAREGDVARAREALGVIASAVLSAPRARGGAARFTVFCNHVAAKVLRRSMQRLMDMAWGRFGGEDLVVYFDATWPDRVPEAAKAHLMLFKPCATVKLFLPQILDPTIRWAVYLDTDVVFAADPAALWLGAVGTLAAAGAAVAAAAEHGDVAPSCEGSAEHYYNQSAAAGPSRAPSRTTARTRAKFAYAPAFGRLYAFFLTRSTRRDDGGGSRRGRAAADFERPRRRPRGRAAPCRAIAELALSLVRAAPTR